MAEVGTFSGIPESETVVLKETLQAQQQLLQKLYVELDQEREASATATSEALSMILRLQGEKAAVKMEANHYKRLAEEKMCHAEESLEIFEDLIYQKEMEIASLEFQVQAFKCRLLSLGCADIGGDNRFPENLLLQGSDANGGSVRRHASLPPIPLKDSQHKRISPEREKSPPVVDDSVPKKLEKEISVENFDSGKKVGGNDSYWLQIKALDEQVKEIAHCNESSKEKMANLNTKSRSCSLPSNDPSGQDFNAVLDEVQSGSNLSETDPVGTFEDIFEVPKLKEIRDIQNKESSKNGDKLGTVNSSSEKARKLFSVEGTNTVKQILVECNLARVHPETAVSETHNKFQHLNRRIERLEEERGDKSPEIPESSEEEKKLLREIHEQLNTIKAEIISLGHKETPVPTSEPTPVLDDEPVHCIKEAMLHFWSRFANSIGVKFK